MVHRYFKKRYADKAFTLEEAHKLYIEGFRDGMEYVKEGDKYSILKDVDCCVICGRHKIHSQHVDTCSETCYQVLLVKQRAVMKVFKEEADVLTERKARDIGRDSGSHKEN